MKRHGFRKSWSVLIFWLAVVAIVPALSSTTLAKKGGGGNGGGKGGGKGRGDYRMARIDLGDSSRIKSDGQAFCVDESDPDAIWDYWDQHDTALTDQNPGVLQEDGVETSVSGGGRLFFYTLGRIGVLPVEPDRWLVLDLAPDPDDPIPFVDEYGNGPNIDQDAYGNAGLDDPVPPTNENTYVDNVKCTIALDVMFKKRATRQPLTVQVCRPASAGGWEPAGWGLHSVEGLYIVEDPDDKNVRILTTANPDDPTGENDADLFELWHNGEVVGVYCIPLSWKMQVVDAP